MSIPLIIEGLQIKEAPEGASLDLTSNLVTVSTPTENEQVANKQYVDDAIAAGGGGSITRLSYINPDNNVESYAEISGQDFRVEVEDDVRIFSNDVFRIVNNALDNGISIETVAGTFRWEFSEEGNLILPENGEIRDIDGNTLLSSTITIPNWNDIAQETTAGGKTLPVSLDSWNAFKAAYKDFQLVGITSTGHVFTMNMNVALISDNRIVEAHHIAHGSDDEVSLQFGTMASNTFTLTFRGDIDTVFIYAR